jgi:Flp pilus assembly CpaE family ATPase
MSNVSKQTLRVLLIEDDPEYAELVRIWLAPNENVAFVLHWADSLVEGLNTLSRGGVDVILLDLGLPDSHGYETFITAKTYTPSAPIIVLSGSDTESLAVRMVQEGAQDYIIKSACNPGMLSKALQFAAVRPSNPAATAQIVSNKTRVVGVMGSKGGVGATTIACSLAVELHKRANETALLVDLNLDGGLVSFLMNAESDFSILDAINNVHRLDRSFWGGIAAHHPSGLDVVRSPGMLGSAPYDIDKLRHVLTLVRPYYRWIILDVGRLNEVSGQVLDRIDELLLVTTTSVPGLYEAKRTIGALGKAEFEGDRLRLIVNQLGNTQDFRGSELDKVFGIPVYAKLSGAARELHDACVRAKLPADDSDFRRQIATLARKMGGIPPAEQHKSTISQIFSFADKFRKHDSEASPIPRG